MLVTLTGPLLCLLAPRHTETPREERKLRTAQTILYLEQKKKTREMVEENGTGDAGTFGGTARCVPESTRPAHRGGAGKRLSLPGGCRALVVGDHGGQPGSTTRTSGGRLETPFAVTRWRVSIGSSMRRWY